MDRSWGREGQDEKIKGKIKDVNVSFDRLRYGRVQIKDNGALHLHQIDIPRDSVSISLSTSTSTSRRLPLSRSRASSLSCPPAVSLLACIEIKTHGSVA